ncbi:hypothetical protein BD410DRAFT_867209 [Rickenella mellea]|uniref:Uncharacterized protein n=1 Tax=Rickenella mellea TaxID=50990 RepID=A0A4Y7Q2Z1_9AGAM|nr:hypothetical protein BD410DRAFT_867209 [Rickenella mellea]
MKTLRKLHTGLLALKFFFRFWFDNHFTTHFFRFRRELQLSHYQPHILISATALYRHSRTTYLRWHNLVAVTSIILTSGGLPECLELYYCYLALVHRNYNHYFIFIQLIRSRALSEGVRASLSLTL